MKRSLAILCSLIIRQYLMTFLSGRIRKQLLLRNIRGFRQSMPRKSASRLKAPHQLLQVITVIQVKAVALLLMLVMLIPTRAVGAEGLLFLMTLIHHFSWARMFPAIFFLSVKLWEKCAMLFCRALLALSMARIFRRQILLPLL